MAIARRGRPSRHRELAGLNVERVNTSVTYFLQERDI